MPWYKKLFFILTTIPIVVWITIKFVVFKASAAMVAPSVLSGLALILAGLLASAGVTVNTDSGSYSGDLIYDLPPVTIEQAFLQFAHTEEGKQILTASHLIEGTAAAQLSNWINDNIKMSSGGGSGDNNDPEIGPVGNALTTAGALALAKTVVDWIKEHQDSVKTETVEGDYPNIEGAKSILYFYGNNAYTAYYSKEPGRIHSRTSTSFGYTINFFCVVTKYSDGTSETNYYENASGGTYNFSNPAKVRFIGEWIDLTNNTDFENSEPIAGGVEPLPIGSLDVEGVQYPINPDGSVTINGVTYYPNNNGTYTIPSVTNEGNTTYNTYSPTYNISNYDDSAVIDLLTELTKQVQGLYPQPDEPTIENIEVTLNNSLVALAPLVEVIPYNGWRSVFAVIESAVFVKSQPEDIVLKFNTSLSENDVGGEFVLIPASIIEDWHDAIVTIKLLVSVVLLYFWLKFALRTITSMIN